MLEKIKILADTDDLGGDVERNAEIIDNRRLKSHRELLERDIRPAGAARQPRLPAERPDSHPARVQWANRARRAPGRQNMCGDPRKVWRRYYPAVKAAHWRLD